MVSELGLAGPWCLGAGSSQELADKGMCVLLLGYGRARGSSAQLLTGKGIDFYQGLCCLSGFEVPVFGRPGAWELGLVTRRPETPAGS